jgi:hypothetical protein
MFRQCQGMSLSNDLRIRLVSLVIFGSPENKNELALGKGFKPIGSDVRIIHDTNESAIGS